MLLPIYPTISLLCINSIVKNHTQNGNYAAVIHIHTGLELYFPTVRINLAHSPEVPARAPNVYIVNTSDVGVDELLELRSRFGYDSHTKYIFISDESTFLEMPVNSTVFRRNTLFISSSDGGIYSYTEDGSGFQMGRRTGSCSQDSERDLFEKTEVLKGKVLHLCMFLGAPYVLYHNDELGGLEIEYWKIILRSLEIKGKFTPFNVPRGTNQEDFFHEVLTNGSCDIFSGMFPIEGNYDISHVQTFDAAHWVLKTPKEIPRWRYAVEVFTKKTWMFWFSSAVVLSATHFFIDKVRGQEGRPTDGLIVICKHFLQQSERLQPSSLSHMLLLSTILLTTFCMNLFYLSRFTFLLTGLKYEPDVNTFEDVMENGYTVRFWKGMMQFFQEPRILEYLEKHFQDSGLNLNVTDDRVVTLFFERMFDYQMPNFLDENHRPELKMLEKPIIILPFMSILRKASPFTDLINRKFDRMFENGVNSFITMNFTAYKVDKDPHVDVKKLTLHSIQLFFFLWIIGIVACFMQFLYELMGQQRS